MKHFHGALIGVLLSVTFGRVDAFWRMVCSTIQVGRVDPIISPGGVSGHTHTIAGPNNLNTTSTFASLQASFCTSCSIQKDKSAYWTPQLYYRHRNGSFEDVPHDGTVVYYLDRGVDVLNMIPFPPGMRMLSGDSAARAYDPNTLTFNNASYAGRPISDRVSFACLDSSGPSAETPNLNRTKCSSGLRAQIHFQTCWDGVNLYKSDQSHVAYLSDMDNGVCPPTHPKLFPHLFFEVIYSVNSINQSDGGIFVFANGDTTGYGFHGDFLNGWDVDVQTRAVQQCMGPNAINNGQISLCPSLNESVDNFYSQNCPEQRPIVNETVKGLLKVLPGCNPPTGGPLRAAQNICPVQPGLNPVTNQDYLTRAVAIPGQKVGNWSYLGCAFDTSTPRPLAGASYQDSTSMTIESCTKFCHSNGYPLAGMEFSTQCYCGGALSQPLQNNLTCATQPYMICSGNVFEFCGGQQLMQVWQDTSYSGPAVKGIPVPGTTVLSLPSNTNATYAGCYVEGVGGRALSGSSYTNTANMSLENCAVFCQKANYVLFGTEYSSECYCGNSISTTAVGQGNCSSVCSGDKTEFCGGGSRLSVWSLNGTVPTTTANSVTGTATSTAAATASGIQYLNCYSETNPRALVTYFTSSTSMTVDQCALTAQAMNLQYFGLEYASQCLAGNVISPLSSVISAATCNKPCAGNSKQICGGNSAISLYNNTLFVKPMNPSLVKIPNQIAQFGYVGCYGEPTAARALGPTFNSGAYSITSGTMTVESCAALCYAKGYLWMGVENGDECYCNSAGIVNAAKLSPGGDADCSTVCIANNTENCGGASKINIYQLKLISAKMARAVGNERQAK